MAFAILADEFMNERQQEAYQELSIAGRKSFLKYVGDEYITELCEEFGIS